MPVTDIEQRALQLFQTREANRAARERRLFIPGSFTGAEREYCLASAESHIAEEAHEARRQQSIIDGMARMSDDDLQYWIDRLTAEAREPNYLIATDSYSVKRDRDQLGRYRDELQRRNSQPVPHTQHEAA